ncbi:cation:proton antiporter [Candidatus Woesearchaeota archaeon]|nr:cation:proton antiporter [Candidatus Woesearchaeota archaeon]
MALETVFAAIGIIILLGFFSDWIFSKTSIPDVFWLILIGILIGPILHLSTPESIGQTAQIFTSFVLLFLLFEGGLHIRIKDLMKSMYGATAITVINFVLTVTAVTLIAQAFGWNFATSILLGTILGGTSSAVVVPMVRRLRMEAGNSLMLVLESAFTDVLCIVSTLTIIQIVKLDSINLGNVLNSLFGSFAIAIFVGGIAGFLWILLLERFEALSKSYISTIGILLIIFGLTEFAKSSGAIAALTFGIIMGNSRKILSLAEGEEEQDALSSSARVFFSQISFFVKTFFFVYIGMLMSLSQPKLIVLGLVITITVFLIRPISVSAVCKGRNNSTDRAIMEAMVPKGLAAAVLAQITLQQGIKGAQNILTPVFSTIFFTVAVTTIMVFLIKHGKYAGTTAGIMRIIGKKAAQQNNREIQQRRKSKKRKPASDK